MNHSKVERIAVRFAERSSISIIPYGHQFLEGTLSVAREIHARSLYAHMPMDEAKVIRQLSAAPDIVPDRWFRIAVRGDEVLGGFYGVVTRFFFNDLKSARDLGWWVRDTARGGIAAVMLLREFETWARNSGAVMCQVGQSGVENIDRTLKLYQHCGYRLTGYNTAKEL